MKKYLLTGLLAAFLLCIPLNAFAGSRDYVEDLLDEWWDYAEDENYEIIDWDIDVIDDETIITYTIDLDRGYYVFIAEGGENIVNLDMAAWYQDEYDDGDEPFAEDTYDDNYPIIEFELRNSDTIVIELWVDEFSRRVHEDYYCILFAKEQSRDRGRDRDRDR